MKWIADNTNWLFSGVGLVVLSVLGYFLKRFIERRPTGQRQVADRGAVGIQAGRDVQVGNNNKQGDQ